MKLRFSKITLYSGFFWFTNHYIYIWSLSEQCKRFFWNKMHLIFSHYEGKTCWNYSLMFPIGKLHVTAYSYMLINFPENVMKIQNVSISIGLILGLSVSVLINLIFVTVQVLYYLCKVMLSKMITQLPNLN